MAGRPRSSRSVPASSHRREGAALATFAGELLGLLHDDGPMGQRELGETMGIDPSILVTMLNPLEESGFVTRRRDAADRRRHTVLRTAGKKQLTKAARAQREAEDVVFAGLDDEQREQLRQLLLRLRDSITTAESPPAAQADDSPH